MTAAVAATVALVAGGAITAPQVKATPERSAAANVMQVRSVGTPALTAPGTLADAKSGAQQITVTLPKAKPAVATTPASAATPAKAASVAKKSVATKATAKKATAKKSVAKKATAKKATAKKSVAKKSVAKKATATKAPAKKSVAKKSVTKSAGAKAPVAKKATAKKSATKKATTKKAAAKKTSKKSSKKKSTKTVAQYCASPNPVKASGGSGKSFLSAINKERAKLGIKPLKWSSSLAGTATKWSGKMLKKDLKTKKLIDGLAHNPNRGASGENVAVVYSSAGYSAGTAVARMHTNLVNSNGHCLNLMNPKFTSMGAGVSKSSDGTTWYATQNFR